MADPYTYDALVGAYRDLGVEPGRVVYVTSDLGRLMAFEKPGKQEVIEAHYEALMGLIGPSGTLVVPTASMNICNTDIPFDLEKTPSYRVSVFSEFVRQKKGAFRSFHPFMSYTAIGAKAEQITGNVSRYAFGPMTPEARLVEENALSVSVGLKPNITCSTVHLVEQAIAVPYRYTKEYSHPVVRGGKGVCELFYLYVWYRDSDIKRDYCKRIFSALEGDLEIKEVSVGRGKIYSYSTVEFFDKSLKLFVSDPYIWCEKTPTIRPWEK